MFEQTIISRALRHTFLFGDDEDFSIVYREAQATYGRDSARLGGKLFRRWERRFGGLALLTA